MHWSPDRRPASSWKLPQPFSDEQRVSAAAQARKRLQAPDMEKASSLPVPPQAPAQAFGLTAPALETRTTSTELRRPVSAGERAGLNFVFGQQPPRSGGTPQPPVRAQAAPPQVVDREAPATAPPPRSIPNLGNDSDESESETQAGPAPPESYQAWGRGQKAAKPAAVQLTLDDDEDDSPPPVKRGTKRPASQTVAEESDEESDEEDEGDELALHGSEVEAEAEAEEDEEDETTPQKPKRQAKPKGRRGGAASARSTSAARSASGSGAGSVGGSAVDAESGLRRSTRTTGDSKAAAPPPGRGRARATPGKGKRR
ncbi:hypothetical protein PENSPDRAFT_695258 [Peniophora sp. CONT]|nr:hypothetical protein PENSPDRAFT_695258 [Peniophora sp. CONT]